MVGLENQEEPMLQMKLEGHLLKNSLLLWGSESFVLFRPSTDWMRPTSTGEDNLIYSNLANLNVNLIQITLTDTSRVMFDHISGHHRGPAELTHNVSNHSGVMAAFFNFKS